MNTGPWSKTSYGQVIHHNGQPVAMADTTDRAQTIVTMLNAQEAGMVATVKDYAQRLADVRAELGHRLAIADRRATNAEAHSAQAAEVEHMCNALRLIDRYGCTKNTSGRCWDGGRTREAEYSDDAWCDACVAADALQGITSNTPPTGSDTASGRGRPGQDTEAGQ
jgi:hypothetical protein